MDNTIDFLVEGELVTVTNISNIVDNKTFIIEDNAQSINPIKVTYRV